MSFGLKVRRGQHDVRHAELRPPGRGWRRRGPVAGRVPQVPGETSHHAALIRLFKPSRAGPSWTGSPERSEAAPSCDWPAFQSGHSQSSLVEKRQKSLRYPPPRHFPPLSVFPCLPRLFVCLSVCPHSHSSSIYWKRPQRRESRIWADCSQNSEQFFRREMLQVSDLNQPPACKCVVLCTCGSALFVWECKWNQEVQQSTGSCPFEGRKTPRLDPEWSPSHSLSDEGPHVVSILYCETHTVL